MRKDITIDGLNKTTYMKDDMEGKIVTKEEINITPHLQHNKRLLTLNDEAFWRSSFRRNKVCLIIFFIK